MNAINSDERLRYDLIVETDSFIEIVSPPGGAFITPEMQAQGELRKRPQVVITKLAIDSPQG